jgi:hypothetical protein
MNKITIILKCLWQWMVQFSRNNLNDKTQAMLKEYTNRKDE